MIDIRLALNPDTTPLSVSDKLMEKSLEERAAEASESDYPAVNVDRAPGLTPARAREIVKARGLQVASGFFQGHFQDPGQEEQIYAAAVEQAEFSRELGQDTLFVSAHVSPPERWELAGRITPQEKVALSEEQFRQMAKVLERIAGHWKEAGIQLCYHPHVATYVESPEEIDLLMKLTDPGLVKLGPDTGHLFFGGADPLKLIEKYITRVAALHIKDVRTRVVEKTRTEKLNYRQACALGVWTEIGTGDIDFPGLFNLLRKKNWSGWVIVETDHTELETALESSRLSRRYLKESIGL